ncbi:MAG: hypothetical protein RBS57_06405 [Desulforhabdus sp.]|jgi:hypothetical protein|nr:hypothetical protein [Desulforhabdus sp.]
MENAFTTLDEIEKLAAAMLLWPEDDRVTWYKKIDPFLLKLEGALTASPDEDASRILSELKLHLIMMARLYEPDDLTDDQHHARLLAAIDAFRNCRWLAVK